MSSQEETPEDYLVYYLCRICELPVSLMEHKLCCGVIFDTQFIVDQMLIPQECLSCRQFRYQLWLKNESFSNKK